MAHGLEGHLEGEDEQMVDLENLFEVLNNKNCQALRAKPKVYIVQACRGGGDRAKNMESVFPIQSYPRFRAPAEPCIADVSYDLLLSPSFCLILPFPLLGVSEQRDPGETVGGDNIVMSAKDSLQTIPTYTDILHVYSTVEGMSSQLTQGSLCSPTSPAAPDP